MPLIPRRMDTGRVLRGRARSPTPADVPTVDAAIARTPPVQVPGDAFGAGAFEEVVAGGRGVASEASRVAQKEIQAAQRIETQREAVDVADRLNIYEEEATTRLLELETEADLSRTETITEYGQFLRQRRDELLSEFQGSEFAKLRLQERLEEARSVAAGRAGAKSADVGRQKVADVLGRNLNRIETQAYESPHDLADLFLAFDDRVDDVAAALTPDQEREYRAAGRERIAIGRIEAYFDQNEFGAVQEVMDSPALQGVLSAETRMKYRRRISDARMAETKEIREAQKKLAAAEFLAGRKLLPHERLELAGLSGVPEPAKDEFNRNLDRLMELEAAGQKDTREYALLAQRVARQTASTQQGLAFSFNPETGEFTVTQGPAQGLGAGLSASQALAQQTRFDSLDSTLSALDAAIAAIEEDPTRAGVFGTVRRGAQRIVGAGEDFGTLVASLTGMSLDNLAEQSQQSILQDENIPVAEKREMFQFFDPALPQMEILENTLALELAKLRILSGGSSIRALQTAFNDAKRDVSMTGLTSSQEVLTRLKTVRAEFETERQKMANRLSGQGLPTVASDADWEQIPPGSEYIAPDGTRRRKQ